MRQQHVRTAQPPMQVAKLSALGIACGQGILITRLILLRALRMQSKADLQQSMITAAGPSSRNNNSGLIVHTQRHHRPYPHKPLGELTPCK